jgi:hypothetical protein
MEQIHPMEGRLVKMETTLEYVKKKLDDFVDAADGKYATKEEVAQLRKDLDKNAQTLQELIIRWGPTVGIVGLLVMQLLKG